MLKLFKRQEDKLTLLDLRAGASVLGLNLETFGSVGGDTHSGGCE